MNTEQLIAGLAADLAPVGRHPRARRIAAGIAAGGLVTALLVAAGLGIRPDLGTAMGAYPFWMKWTYTLWLTLAAAGVTARLACPEKLSAQAFWPLLLPVGALALAAVAEMLAAPPQAWTAMWLGHTARICPVLVFALSLPILTGLLRALRGFAPTQPRAAGAAAGLASGASAAFLYCLHCPEVAASFVLTWYTLGAALTAGLGALLGPRVLRW